MPKETKNTESPNKSEICVTEWLVSKHIKFVSYTALWCNPCKKIKPDVLKYMKSHDIRKSARVMS